MKAKKLTLMAALLGFALIIFIAEAQLPPVAPLPGIKLGLANIITLMAIYMTGRREASVILALRIILSSIFAGNFTGFLYSISGGLLSLIVMCLLSFMFDENKMWIVSVFGAIAHNAGQIITACIVIGSAQVLWYFPYLMISAVLTGVFTGIAAQITLKKLRKTKLLKGLDDKRN